MTRKAGKNLDKALQLIQDAIARPDAFPDEFIAMPLDPDILRKVLTPERVRLLNTLREDGPYESVNALADALGREQTRVSRDVNELASVGLVTTERHGKTKRVIAHDKPIILR